MGKVNLRPWREKGKKRNFPLKVGVLVNIRSAHNVGSIFRTADAAGFTKLYLVGYTPGPVDEQGAPRVQLMKVSLGAERMVDWEKWETAEELFNFLRRHNYFIVALEQTPGAIPYHSFAPPPRPLALVVGNEVEGISAALLQQADAVVAIPMLGRKESLNVSVAFGVMAYRLAFPCGEERTGE